MAVPETFANDKKEPGSYESGLESDFEENSFTALIAEGKTKMSGDRVKFYHLRLIC